jgi:hypothetical protein
MDEAHNDLDGLRRDEAGKQPHPLHRLDIEGDNQRRFLTDMPAHQRTLSQSCFPEPGMRELCRARETGRRRAEAVYTAVNAEAAETKLIWLAICDIEDKRARAREADRGKPAGKRTALPRLVEGATTQGWKAALGAFEIAFPGRIPGSIN